jgi:hypothetical protein
MRLSVLLRLQLAGRRSALADQATLTPFQKAILSVISAAAGFGSG